jgi:hypothetical protein
MCPQSSDVPVNKQNPRSNKRPQAIVFYKTQAENVFNLISKFRAFVNSILINHINVHSYSFGY